MEVVIVPTADDAAGVVADVIARRAGDSAPRRCSGWRPAARRSAPTPCSSTSTGPGASSFARASAVLLDEYVGLPPDHPEAYRTFIRRELDRPRRPPAGSPVRARRVGRRPRRRRARATSSLLAELGGVDVQLLGIGSDGHIGFNEPGSSLGSRTRIKTLTEATRGTTPASSPSLDEVPRHVVTQGLATIGEARHLVLVATGAAKAAPIARAVEGPLTAMCPASVLQLHPHATVVVDEAAAAELQLADYYRAVYAGKPDWQPL